ncbi:MAG TPA: tetratricopeptide repeat protein, partial [Planctomycetota bacterium]|nr:tetratricopeptide repeat protein [Planctomycetota bacterium]
LAQHPQHLPSLDQLGRLCWSLGRKDDALAAFARLAEADARNPEAHRQLARAQAAAGHPDLAVRSMEHALSVAVDAPLLSDFAWLLATNPDPSVRDGRRALDLALRAVAGAPTGPREVILLAAACAEAGDFERGVREIDQALARLPAEVAPALGALKEKLGRHEAIRAEATFP